ncbi:MAG: helix-turn-helix transcriptional regulator [Capsulimonadaceae bacterium]|nr:helix-turn-helix transcriptional regulator [Capsulimonadaceae bacterium]
MAYREQNGALPRAYRAKDTSVDISLLPFIEIQPAWVSRQSWNAGDCLRRHITVPNALWCMLEGSVEIDIGGQTSKITPPLAALMPTCVPRDIWTPAGAEWISIGASISIFGAIDLFRGLNVPILCQPASAAWPNLVNWANALCEMWAGPSGIRRENPYLIDVAHIDAFPFPQAMDRALMCQGLTRAIFGLLWTDLQEPTSAESVLSLSPSWLMHAMAIIRRNPAVDTESLAFQVGISQSQLRRGFKKWIGQSPQAFITRQRLEEARRLISATDQTVAAVAANTGFESLSYFTTLFEKTYGATPGRYRKVSLNIRL